MGLLKHNVGWALAEPTEARQTLKLAKAWKPDAPVEAPLVPLAVAPGPDVTNKTKN